MTPTESGASLRVVWIGLAEVQSSGDRQLLDGGELLLSPSEAAYVHVLGLAVDADAFVTLAKAALRRKNLELISLEGADTLTDRQRLGYVSHALLRIADSIDENNNVMFGTFQVFDNED